jgi:hypothetical protein
MNCTRLVDVAPHEEPHPSGVIRAYLRLPGQCIRTAWTSEHALGCWQGTAPDASDRGSVKVELSRDDGTGHGRCFAGTDLDAAVEFIRAYEDTRVKGADYFVAVHAGNKAMRQAATS